MIFCGHFILQIDLSYFEVVGFEKEVERVFRN